MTSSRAMLCALAGFFLWVVSDSAVKLGSQTALSPFVIMTISGTVGAIGILGLSAFRRDMAALRPQNGRGQSIICLCSVVISYFNVIALKHLPLTIFYIVAFMAPLAIAGLSTVLKHETLTPVKIMCLIAGFLGVILAVATRHWESGEWIGYLAAFANVFIFAISTVTMRNLSRTDTVVSTQLVKSMSVGIAGITGIWMLSPSLPVGWVLLMLIVAGVINVCGNILYNTALHNTVSSNVAQLHYTQIISGAILGYLIWHEVPTWNLLAGSMIIIASGMIVAAQARRLEAAAR
jgi:drug/metabolite transporter (DMT)-like permease